MYITKKWGGLLPVNGKLVAMARMEATLNGTGIAELLAEVELGKIPRHAEFGTRQDYGNPAAILFWHEEES